MSAPAHKPPGGNRAGDAQGREARKALIAQLNREGLRDTEIARRLNIARGTVSYFLDLPARRAS